MSLFKTLITLLFICFWVNLSSQEKNKISVKNNTKANQPFYRIKPSDLFYIGVENRFILYQDPSKKYLVTIKNGTILSKDTSLKEEVSKDSSIYYITTKNTEPTFIYVTVDGKTFTYKFRNRKIPSPILVVYMGSSLNTNKGGEVKAADFSKAENVVLTLNDFDYDCGFHIVNMEITKVSNGENKNYLLTDNKIGDIAKWCAPGEIYILHNVVIEFTATKDQRSINGTTFFIK